MPKARAPAKKSQFDAPHFQSVEAARTYLEALRWGSHRVCPHCGTVNKSFPTKKPGVYRCQPKECRKDFSVTTKSVMESSHIKLNVWLQAFYLLCTSKKGMSSHQLHRTLGITYKSAWFLSHRIREAMRQGGLTMPMGGEDKVVEADTTYIGGKEANKHRNKRDSKKIGGMGKEIVHTLVERDGSARSHHIASISGKTLRPLLKDNVSRKSTLMTDTAGGYMGIGKEFERHEMVDHGIGEYVRGDAHSNTVEGYFSILKRGITGIYHSVSAEHLNRYLSEFDFRYSNRVALGVGDIERTDRAIKGGAGKRLTYRPVN
jgi:transposase-like protein